MTHEQSPSSRSSTEDRTVEQYDAVIVGAGFGGMYAVYHLRRLGFRVRAVESGTGVGGTWFWNRYPGARCDVESMQYSYSFSEELQQEWDWSERFAAQPEILAYAEHVAQRFDILKDIQFSTTVERATYDEQARNWTLTTTAGDELKARFCIMATGNLSAPRLTPLPGQEQFKGKIYFTAQWPAEGVDLTGLRVGVVGTSASGTQSIPHFAAQASQLYVFQRTANFSVPSWNGPLTAEERQRVKADYKAFRARQAATRAGMIMVGNDKKALDVDESERAAEFERFWKIGGLNFTSSFADIGVDLAANDTAADFVRNKIRAVVQDSATAEALSPKDHAIGTRRLCTDNGYYAAFNRPNVSLVDVRATPVVTVTPTGLRTTERDYDLDVLVMATGFEAMTGALSKIDIRGRRGFPLKEAWRNGPNTYLGLAIAGFPNLFIQTGPHSPSTLVSLILGNEQHVNWIGGCLSYMRERGLSEVEASKVAETAWVEHAQSVAKKNLKYHAKASSYIFNGEDGSRTFMVYLAGFDRYAAICDEVAVDGYRGFEFAPDRNKTEPAEPASATMMSERPARTGASIFGND